MRFFDKATEDFFKAFFTKQITHGGDAEKFSFVRVKSSSSDYFNHCRFIYISAIGAAFDQLPPVPLPIADGSLQGIFFNVRCPRDQAIEFAEDAFNLFVFQKRGSLKSCRASSRLCSALARHLSFAEPTPITTLEIPIPGISEFGCGPQHFLGPLV